MKRRAYISFLIIPLFFAKVAFCQLEATNWYFGSTCSALKFLPTGTVTIAANGYTPFGAEGCSVLSDPQTGTLKFYTDGNVVIDATHHVMPNGYGLVALTSSWGSGKIVMDPVACSRYYIFHNDGTGEGLGQRRLYYSMVDLNLPGNGTVFNPKGDVSASIKNILISNNVVEGIEIAPVAANHDFWILVTSNSPSALHVYKFTSGSPSLINSYPLLNQPTDIRAIRFCETNNKLAIASCNDFEDVLVMDFNTSTGEITNQTVIPSFPAKMNGVGNGVYDLCWSPDGSKLYISKYIQGSTGGKLYQYNFSNTSTQLVYDVNPASNLFPAKGLKLGPDGKIYFMYTTPDGQMRFLGTVNQPNNPPETCNFNPRQVNMSADIRNAGKFPDFVYANNQLKQYADTVVNINTPCNFTSLEMDMYLPLAELDDDKDHLTYSIQSVHSPTTSATLLNSSLKYKNTAKPSYTDTVTIQYCDDYCIKKCRTFHVIIHVNAMSSTLNLPDSITSCLHDPIQLDAGAGFRNYAWSTGETTQKIFVSSNGTYKVTAQDANGCVYTDSTSVTFKSQLIFSLGNDTAACDSFLLKLNSSFSHILWSTGSNADAIMIRTSGSYSVTVTNKEGCSASDTISIIVYNPPAINLGGPYNYCENIPIHQIFKITGMKAIFWSTGSTQDSIIVTAPGTYSVNVTDMKGCKASGQVTVATLPLPVPAFSVSNACTGTSNQFIDASAIASGKIQKRQWDFGDGTINQFDSIVQHTYLTSGTFLIKLIVTSDGNCIDSATRMLSVYGLPVVAFDYKIICPGNRITFFNNSTSQDSITEWKWNFGDGTTDQQKNPLHTFALKGTYPVGLTAKTDKGCISSLTKQVAIQTALKANFTAKNSCEGKKITLTDQSSIDEPSKTNYLWDFGDGTPLSTEKFPQHIYEFQGNYWVKLVLSSGAGCADSISKQIRINPNPKAAFRATNASGCSPLATSFIDESTIQTGKIVSWQWQLGIRNSTAQNPEQVYRNLSPNIATYDVRLIVASDSGCSAELLKPKYVNIYPSPTANFSLSPKIVSVSDAIISFKNNSQGTDSVLWDFGDHTHSTDFNAAPHQYTFPDTFVVKLIVYTRYGCTDTITKEIIVQPEFTFYIPNSFSPNDDGLNDYFSGKGEEILEYEMVIFNRLGDVMFRTTNMEVPWNGSKNNNSEQAAQDVYVYTINIVDKNKKKHFYKGIVTLVR